MIENVSTQLTVFHCFAHCLLPGRAFASLYALLFLEKEAEIGGRVVVALAQFSSYFHIETKMTKKWHYRRSQTWLCRLVLILDAI